MNLQRKNFSTVPKNLLVNFSIGFTWVICKVSPRWSQEVIPRWGFGVTKQYLIWTVFNVQITELATKDTRMNKSYAAQKLEEKKGILND